MIGDPLPIAGKKMAFNPQSAIRNPQWKRWNDYGIGLLEQSQYGQAAAAFRQASALSPNDPNLLVNTAIAEMRTERFGPEREQWSKAGALLDAAMKIDPSNWRTRYFRALVLRGDGKLQEAASELQQIANRYPRDREVQRALGQTLYSLGNAADARLAFESVTAIDPTDFGAWSFLSSIYLALGRKPAAGRAQSLYLDWRDDPLAYNIEAVALPATGQWTIVIDPNDSLHTQLCGGLVRVFAATARLYDVPPDITGTIAASGQAVPLSVTTPGQNALLTFGGLTGQRICLAGTQDVSTSIATDVKLYSPGTYPSGTPLIT
ncbi:MAG: tetratricopeptide repeat protein [Gammaproteobacteria bacterium]